MRTNNIVVRNKSSDQVIALTNIRVPNLTNGWCLGSSKSGSGLSSTLPTQMKNRVGPRQGIWATRPSPKPGFDLTIFKSKIGLLLVGQALLAYRQVKHCPFKVSAFLGLELQPPTILTAQPFDLRPPLFGKFVDGSENLNFNYFRFLRFWRKPNPAHASKLI